MVRIFIVYGGEEGEKLGRQIESYFKSNNIGAFLASPLSPEIAPTDDFESRIDFELKNANLAIIVVTNGINSSQLALDEINRILDELGYPYIPFVKDGATMPERLNGKWHVSFKNDSLSNNELEFLELKMWRYYDQWKDKQTQEKMEGEEIPTTKIYGLEMN